MIPADRDGVPLAARRVVVAALSPQTSFEHIFAIETLRVLRQRISNRASHRARDLAEVIAQLAIRAAAGAGLVLARYAVDELLERMEHAEHAVIVQRPRDGTATGWYTVACDRSAARDAGRQHDVWIGTLAPIEASCDCADYCKASLGACSHVLAVLFEVQGQRDIHALRPGPSPIVRWDPIRPLSGLADWIDRMSLDGAERGPRLPRPKDAGAWIETLTKLRTACNRPRVAEPAVRALVEREWQLAMTRGVTLAEIDRELATLRKPLFDYQREGVLRFFETGRLLLGDDMGLGKTAQAISIAHVLLASRRIERVLVIVPSPLRWQWAQEWSRFTSTVAHVVDGPPSRRRRMYKAGDRVLVMSYEQLRRDLEHVQTLEPELVILDEAQRIKNAETVTARCVKQLAPAWRLAMTGTPLENRLEELASIFEWVNDMVLEPRWRITPWHSIPTYDNEGIAGLHDLKTLRTRMAPHFVRRVRAEVLRQLPARRDTNIPVPMTGEQLHAHDSFNAGIRHILRNKRRLTREEFLRLMGILTEQRMICDALALARFDIYWPMIEAIDHPMPQEVEALRAPKLELLAELLRSIVIEQRRKVVVFSQWRRMLQLAEWATRDLLHEAGVRGEYFSGQERPQQRIANLVQFHEDPSVRVLWATDAGSVGLNLQRAASCCVNLELPWNPAVLEQRIGRIYRLGQPDPVDVYNLVSIGGIEQRIAQLIEDKRAMFDELFDGENDTLMFDGASSRMEWIRNVAGAPDHASSEAAT